MKMAEQALIKQKSLGGENSLKDLRKSASFTRPPEDSDQSDAL